MHTALFVLLLSILTLGVLGGPVPEWTGAPSRTQDQSTKRDEFGGRLAAPGWVPPPPSRDVEAKANLDDELPIEKRIVSGLVIRDSPLNGRGEQQIEGRTLEARVPPPWRIPTKEKRASENRRFTASWRKPASQASTN